MYKVKLLIFIDWFDPAYKAGGPVQSILALANALEGWADIAIITSNVDVDGSRLAIEENHWQVRSESLRVIYLASQQQSILSFKRLINEIDPDCIYINGMFSWKFSVLPLLILRLTSQGRRVVLAPRGMLGAGALQIKKRKKQIFLFLYHLLRVPSGIWWHSTSSDETTDIKKVMGDAISLSQIPNLPRPITGRRISSKSSGVLHLFFFSRISPKKNLKGVLDALKLVDDMSLRFHIYGPIEDGAYWHDCERLFSQIPTNVSVVYKGLLQGTQIADALADEHVMVLPTLNENYGHVIVESLFCGCPVILSDQTPWNDVGQSGAGIVVPLNDPLALANAIRHYASMTSDELQRSSEQSIAYIQEKVDVEKITQLYKSFFTMVAGGERSL